MVTNACDVLGDALGVVGDRKPVDVLRFGRAGTCADVGKPLGAELGGLEAVPEQAADDVVCEELHAAVRVVYHEPLRGTEQLVGDDERADRVIAGAAAGVADDVRVTLAETGVPRRVESCVHAGEDGEAPRWRKGRSDFAPKLAAYSSLAARTSLRTLMVAPCRDLKYALSAVPLSDIKGEESASRDQRWRRHAISKTGACTFHVAQPGPRKANGSIAGTHRASATAQLAHDGQLVPADLAATHVTSSITGPPASSPRSALARPRSVERFR